jgi:hypothetical protein
VILESKLGHSGGENIATVCPSPAIGWSIRRLLEKIMSKISCATHNTFTVRELRDDELQEVSGGYNFYNVMVESIVAAQTKTTTACTRMASDDVC